MKKGISIWAYPAGTPLREAFHQAHAAGFDGVELAMDLTGELSVDTTNEGLRAIREAAAEEGVELYSVASAVYWKLPFTSPDEKIAGKAMSCARRQIEIAHALGCDSVLIVPGVVSGEGEPFGNIPYDKAYDRALAAMRELAPYAKERGISLGIENVWNKFLLSPLEMRNFVDAAGPGAAAYFDIGNVQVNGYPDHWIDILGSRICKVHIKDFSRRIGNINGFVPLLSGDVDFKATMAALRRIGYDGWETAEVGTFKLAPADFPPVLSREMDSIFNM